MTNQTDSRILHRGVTIQTKVLNSPKVVNMLKSRTKRDDFSEVLSIWVRAQWFRLLDSPVYTRCGEMFDEKLGESFDDVHVEVLVPILESYDSSWLVAFPNCEVEVGQTTTEITLESDNEDFGYKMSRSDYLRTNRPEKGGRILYFLPGIVTLHDILVLPQSTGSSIKDFRNLMPAAPAVPVEEDLLALVV